MKRKFTETNESISFATAENKDNDTVDDDNEVIISSSFQSYLETTLVKGFSSWVGDTERIFLTSRFLIQEILASINHSSKCSASKTRRELKEKVELVANSLRWKTGDNIETLLDYGQVQVIVNEYLEVMKCNKQMFDNITKHHSNIRNDSWSNSVHDESALYVYAKAASSMGNTPWVVAGQEWIYNHLKSIYYDPRKSLTTLATKWPQLPLSSDDKIKMIDIGSCFNPFQKYRELDVTAVDLQPSHESVIKCDFLHIGISEEISDIELTPFTSHSNKIQFKSHSYDVAVMSLVLSYLPCPQMRMKMICNARKLLSNASGPKGLPGLLYIYEKDSIFHRSKYHALCLNHWKRQICSAGFDLLKYELSITKSTTNREGHRAHIFVFITKPLSENLSTVETSRLYIKQDFQSCSQSESETRMCEAMSVTATFSCQLKEMEHSTNVNASTLSEIKTEESS